MTAIDFGSDRLTRREEKLRRRGSLDVIRQPLIDHWQDITRHLLPRSGRYLQQNRNRSGRHLYNKIIDNVAAESHRTLVSLLMGQGSSPAKPWFSLRTQDPVLARNRAVKIWLKDAVERIGQVFHASNVYKVLPVLYGDLVAFGTTACMIVPDFETVIWLHPSPVGEFMLGLDKKDRVDTVYREFEMSVWQVIQEFGLERVSTRVRDLWRRGKRQWDAPVRILHCVEPRVDRIEGRRDARNMPWSSTYLEMGGDGGPEDLGFLRETGFDHAPFLAPRWMVQAGDTYGYSPGMEALQDIRQLQQEQITKSKAIAYMVEPPLQVPTSLKDRYREMMPGGKSWYQPRGMVGVDQQTPHGGVRSAWDVKYDLNAMILDLQEVRQRIRTAFYADLVLMLAHAGPDTRMTAREVDERHDEKLTILGPALGQVHDELLRPLVEITFKRMMEVGALAPPPADLVSAGAVVTVEFVSNLAQAQKMVGVHLVDRFLSVAGTIGQQWPEALDKIDVDEAVDTYSDMLGVPPEIVRTNESVAELRLAREQANAAREQAEMLQQQAKTVKDVAKATADQPALIDQVTQT